VCENECRRVCVMEKNRGVGGPLLIDRWRGISEQRMFVTSERPDAANLRSASEAARPLRQICVYFLAPVHSETGRFGNCDQAIGGPPQERQPPRNSAQFFSAAKPLLYPGNARHDWLESSCAYAIFSVGSFKPCVDVPHPSCTETAPQTRIISL
jgi:hypothetical protein